MGFCAVSAEAEADQKRIRITALKPGNADKSAAMHCYDAERSMRITHVHAPFLVALVYQKRRPCVIVAMIHGLQIVALA